MCPNRQIIFDATASEHLCKIYAIPARNLVTMPDDVPLEKAALTEVLAVSWHIVRLLALAALHADIVLRAMVLGGGAIGLASALVLNTKGVSNVGIVKPNANRIAGLRALDQTVTDTAAAE